MIRRDIWDTISILIPMVGEKIELTEPIEVDYFVLGKKKRITIKSISHTLMADTNIGRINLPCSILNEEDVKTILNVVIDETR